MIYVIISILMVIIGLVGIVKNKLPKYRDGIGFAAEMNYYLAFYGMFIMGIIFLVIEFFSDK